MKLRTLLAVAALAVPLAGCVVTLAAISVAAQAICGVAPDLTQKLIDSLKANGTDTAKLQTAHDWGVYICDIATALPSVTAVHGRGVTFSWKVVNKERFEAYRKMRYGR